MKVSEVEIHSFWAFKDVTRSLEYYNGREAVLESYGFANVVKSDPSWMKDSAVIVINAYYNGEIIAGMKVHRRSENPLPLEHSLGNICDNLRDVLESVSGGEYAEIGGVWNSKNFAGLNFAHILARYSLAICRFLEYKTVFTFNASYTYKLSRNYGAKLLDEIGDKGWFNYPSPEYKAAIWVFYDVQNLVCFIDEDQKRIEYLTKNVSAVKQIEKETPNYRINYHGKV